MLRHALIGSIYVLTLAGVIFGASVTTPAAIAAAQLRLSVISGDDQLRHRPNVASECSRWSRTQDWTWQCLTWQQPMHPPSVLVPYIRSPPAKFEARDIFQKRFAELPAMGGSQQWSTI